MFVQTNFEQLYGKHFITEALEAVKPRESFEIWKKCYLAFLEPIQVETIMKLHTEGNLQVHVLPEKIDHCRSDYHTWYFHSLMTSTFGAKIFWRHFTWSAPPLLYSWSDSPIGCSAPSYSWSGSLIGSAYYFLYISFCFRFNKSLTNLTSLRQHHLQYKGSWWTDAKICFIAST